MNPKPTNTLTMKKDDKYITIHKLTTIEETTIIDKKTGKIISTYNIIPIDKIPPTTHKPKTRK